MKHEEAKTLHPSTETSRSFVVGLLLSLVLTFAAYYAVVYHVFGTTELTIFIIVLAFVQLAVQLYYFLHMGREPKPRWNLYVFLSTFSVILFIVVASIWIMHHLHYNLMSPSEMMEYTLEKEALDK